MHLRTSTLALALAAAAVSTLTARASGQLPFRRSLLGGQGYERVQGVTADAWVSVEELTASYAFGSGKTSSLGLVPRLSWAGSTGAAANDLRLDVVGAVPHQGGFFAYAHRLTDVPYKGGVRYMGLPIVRLAAVTLSGAGAATCAPAITPDLIGETRVYQFWYRDPAHPDGTGAGMTNALKLTFLP